jgi:hypothetical protein
VIRGSPLALRRSVALLFALGLAAVAGPAASATPENEAGAERLFQEAKALMADGRVPEACVKLAEAKRLEVGGGIVLALGVCHAKEGRNASALADFREALALAVDAKRADRVRLAEEQIARIESAVSTLTIVAPAGVTLRINRQPWDKALLGVAVPVDEGAYVVRADADGKEPWEVTVRVRAEGDRQKVDVPPLAPLADADSRITPAPSLTPPPRDEGGEAARRTRRLAGFVAGGVGIVGLGVGAAFGAAAIVNREQADCAGHLCSGQDGAYAAAKTDAAVATVSAVAGVVGVGAGAILLLTGRSSGPASRSAQVALVPVVTPSGASIGVSGVF